MHHSIISLNTQMFTGSLRARMVRSAGELFAIERMALPTSSTEMADRNVPLKDTAQNAS